MTFISTHGLESVSYVVEQNNLTGTSSTAIETVLSKSDFRIFLQKHNFATPKFIILDNVEDVKMEAIMSLEFPIILKPTNNSANRGITKVHSKDELEISSAINYAFENSPSGGILIEEFITSTKRINGDGIIVDNEIKYSLIGDYFYDNNLNEILPYATTFPSVNLTEEIQKEISRLFRELNYGTGIFNFEAIIRNDKVYFIEINPRHSGNFIYKLMSIDTDLSMAELNVDLAINEIDPNIEIVSKGKILAYCALYSSKDGLIKGLNIQDKLQPYILESQLLFKPGQQIKKYNLTSDKLALLHLEFPNIDVMHDIIGNIQNYYTIEWS